MARQVSFASHLPAPADHRTSESSRPASGTSSGAPPGNAAQQMLLVALGWQMCTDLTSSAWDLGLVGLMQFLPALSRPSRPDSPLDRVDRRRVLAASLVLQALVALVLAWGSGGDWVQRELILALSIVIGVARALQAPAQQALLPSLVPIVQLPQATALSSSVLQQASSADPHSAASCTRSRAGRVRDQLPHGRFRAGIRVGDPGEAVARRAFADLVVLRVRGLPVYLPAQGRARRHLAPPVRRAARRRDRPAADLREGRAADRSLGPRPVALGTGGRCIVHGAVAVAKTAQARRRPADVWVGCRLWSAILGFSVSTSLLLSMIALAISGAADTVSVVIRQTLVQMETPDQMRGRVSAVNATFICASNQLGEFRAGAMAAWLGPIGSVIVGGLGTLMVVALWMRLFPSSRNATRCITVPWSRRTSNQRRRAIP